MKIRKNAIAPNQPIIERCRIVTSDEENKIDQTNATRKIVPIIRTRIPIAICDFFILSTFSVLKLQDLRF